MPAAELVMMIEPPWLATRCGIAALQVRQTPLRLMSITCPHCSSVISAAGALEKMPAFALTMLSLPSCATPLSSAAFSPA